MRQDGERVMPRTAYIADDVVRVSRGARPMAAVLPPQAPVVFIECSTRAHEPVLRVDHHHPGDPGYANGAGRLFSGSSLGQVLNQLPARRNACCRDGF